MLNCFKYKDECLENIYWSISGECDATYYNSNDKKTNQAPNIFLDTLEHFVSLLHELFISIFHVGKGLVHVFLHLVNLFLINIQLCGDILIDQFHFLHQLKIIFELINLHVFHVHHLISSCFLSQLTSTLLD